MIWFEYFSACDCWLLSRGMLVNSFFRSSYYDKLNRLWNFYLSINFLWSPIIVYTVSGIERIYVATLSSSPHLSTHTQWWNVRFKWARALHILHPIAILATYLMGQTMVLPLWEIVGFYNFLVLIILMSYLYILIASFCNKKHGCLVQILVNCAFTSIYEHMAAKNVNNLQDASY